jgi:hypothetical protein
MARGACKGLVYSQENKCLMSKRCRQPRIGRVALCAVCRVRRVLARMIAGVTRVTIILRRPGVLPRIPSRVACGARKGLVYPQQRKGLMSKRCRQPRIGRMALCAVRRVRRVLARVIAGVTRVTIVLRRPGVLPRIPSRVACGARKGLVYPQ